jgi:hypothetical protein
VPLLTPFSTNPVAVDDDWKSLAELFGFTQGQPVRLVEGEIQFSDAASRYRAQPLRPGAGDSGIRVSAGASRLFGPNSPWRLDQVWVREDVAAAGAMVCASGWMEV